MMRTGRTTDEDSTGAKERHAPPASRQQRTTATAAGSVSTAHGDATSVWMLGDVQRPEGDAFCSLWFFCNTRSRSVTTAGAAGGDGEGGGDGEEAEEDVDGAETIHEADLGDLALHGLHGADDVALECGLVVFLIF